MPPERKVVGPGDTVIKARTLKLIQFTFPVLVTAVGGLGTLALDARSKIDDAIREASTAKAELVRHVDASEKRFDKLENAYTSDNKELREALGAINARLTGIETKLDMIAPRRGPRQH